MSKSKVLQFKQSDEFYFNMGKACLQNGEYLKTITYINKAINAVKNKNEFLISSYYLVLAQTYALMNCYELSNFYYFCSLSSEIFAQIVYRGLGENFVCTGDNVSARYYLNKCINLLETSPVAESARNRLALLNEDDKSRYLRVVGKDDPEIIARQKKLDVAESLMSKGKFEQAIQVFEECQDFSDPRVRAELSLAYFFTNDTKKGIALIKDFGEETVLDLCNLLLIYYCDEDKENLKKVKNKLRQLKVTSNEENFKIGLTFAQVEELELAKIYMKNFFAKSDYEPELKFLYSLVCINDKDYEEAKKILIDLKIVNPFNNYIYNYYLNVCDTKPEEKFEYVFNVPVKQFLIVQNQLKDMLTYTTSQLRKEFLNNKDFFYFVVKLPNSNVKNVIISKLAKIEDKNITTFFDYVMLSDGINNNFKNTLSVVRLALDTVNDISLVKDNFYIRVILPNTKVTKVLSKKIFSSLMNGVEYLLSQTTITNINLKRAVVTLERKLDEDTINNKANSSVLSAYICWHVVSKNKQTSLNNICNYFGITQAMFYEFVNTYNLSF